MKFPIKQLAKEGNNTGTCYSVILFLYPEDFTADVNIWTVRNY